MPIEAEKHIQFWSVFKWRPLQSSGFSFRSLNISHYNTYMYNTIEKYIWKFTEIHTQNFTMTIDKHYKQTVFLLILAVFYLSLLFKLMDKNTYIQLNYNKDTSNNSKISNGVTWLGNCKCKITKLIVLIVLWGQAEVSDQNHYNSRPLLDQRGLLWTLLWLQIR